MTQDQRKNQCFKTAVSHLLPYYPVAKKCITASESIASVSVTSRRIGKSRKANQQGRHELR